MYINGGIFTRMDMFLSFLSPAYYLDKNADAIIHEHKLLVNEVSMGVAEEINVHIEPYQGSNEHVRRMMCFLAEHVKDDLIGAYIHGSLATGEEVAYSDFDALVILKSEIFESPKRLALTAARLHVARRIMLNFDPLQHHGWFVVTELDLGCYCNAYFPVELFKYSKSLFEDRGLDIRIKPRQSSLESRKAFEEMANAILGKIKSRRYPENIYQLKLLLSQFMLLPALYLQAKDGFGVYKADSFRAVRSDFDAADWKIMDDVSQIRTSWSYEISTLKRRLMSGSHVLSRCFAKKYAPAIPVKTQRLLTDDFYQRMAKLTSRMKEILN